MGNIGRVICVALPFVLTVASLVALLIGGLGGVADKNMYMFSVNTRNLTISENTLAGLVNSRDLSHLETARDIKTGFDQAKGAAEDKAKEGLTSIVGKPGQNLTAADVGLAADYDLSLWGFCFHATAGSDRICSNPQFDWASKEFNGTAANLEAIGHLTNHKLQLPTEIKKGLSAFSSLVRATQIVLIAAYILLGVELLLGLFTSCSRAMSCLTWVVAGIAATAVVAAAAMATATSAAVVGAIEGTQNVYGVRAAFNTRFLAAMWIAAACAIGAAMFWVWTICCCAPEKRPHRGATGGSGEKGFSAKGPYAPLHDPEHNGMYNRNSHQMTQYGAPRQTSGRSDLAYEPYSNQPYTGAQH